MTTTEKVLVALGVGFLVVGGSLMGTLIGTYNDFTAQEKGLQAQYKQGQSVYDNYYKKLQEAAQVNDKYAKDLKSVFVSALQGRYGTGGSKAVFQFLQEHNPNLDASIYLKLQQIVESGRNEFQLSQTALLDKKRVYETQLNQFPANLVAKGLGFPKIDLQAIGIITSEETDKAFNTKHSEPLQIQ